MVKYLELSMVWVNGDGLTKSFFFFWLKHFLNYVNPGHILLLLLDGHSSHFELGTIELAKETDVIFFACLLILHAEVNL